MCNINASNQNRILDFLKSEDFKKTYDTYLTLKNDSDISFNIFSMISDYYHKENMHTDILKKFLDPNAGHEEGNKFLYLFIDMINELAQQGLQKIYINKKLYKNAKVESQDPINNDDTKEKGYIDILVCDERNKHCIIIENKINNAPDTINQIPKYYKYLKNKKGYDVDAIVYLPLCDYKTPNEESWEEDLKLKREVKQKLIILKAYNPREINFIDSWVIPCSAKSNNIHCISILKQYSKLIKHLKKETMSDNLLNLLIEQKIDPYALKEMVDGIPMAMINKLRYNLSNVIDDEIHQDKGDMIYFVYPNKEKNKFHIDIEAQAQNLRYKLRILPIDKNYKEKFKNFKCPVKMDIDKEENLYNYYDINGLNALIEDIHNLQSAIKDFMK